jgi:hypothetical protein
MEKLPCKSTFDMSVHIVITAIKERLAQGEINEEKLDQIEQSLTVDNESVDAFCHSVYERCVGKSKLDLMVPARTNSFGRVMVQPLEKLLDRGSRRFSEHQLANYFHMLSSTLGRETYERYHDEISALMRREIRDRGSCFTWDGFYLHPDVEKIRIKTLGVIAQTFEHFDVRINWLQKVMEASPTTPDTDHGTMQFTEKQAKAFLLALFDECINMNDNQRQKLDQYLTEDQIVSVAHLIGHAQTTVQVTGAG